ncbi:MAG TPA: TetR/AcrR family transcriptional regulator [Pyrinomonadaceae bacterium]|nr:TetR/AcrR family transcriptional regulator [Pyrinomonadaceae bacterium]
MTTKLSETARSNGGRSSSSSSSSSHRLAAESLDAASQTTPSASSAPPSPCPPQAHPARMAADERRQQIVAVAMRLFSERGFRGTTTKEIAQAAGVSEAIIFRHFATKDELYTAIIDHKACAGGLADLSRPVAEAVEAEVADAIARKDDRAVFEGLARAMMEHHAKDPDFLRLLLFSALEGHQLSQMFWDRNMRHLYHFLGSYVAERQRDGVFRDMNPLVVVRTFVGVFVHHSLNNTLWDRARSILDISDEEAARQFTDVILRGISTADQDPASRAASARRTTGANEEAKARPQPPARRRRARKGTDAKKK